MPSAAKYVSDYFLTFFVGALFGAVYQFTGAAESIARTLSKVSHDKFVAPVIMCITGILTFGGVSGFVVFFVIYPCLLYTSSGTVSLSTERVDWAFGSEQTSKVHKISTEPSELVIMFLNSVSI